MDDAPEPAAAEADSELEPGTVIDGYVIERKIGQGGMGVVYGATQPRIGKRVAIKILGSTFCRDPKIVARFEGEARVVNEIHHPNIVDVFQFGELVDGRSFFVMEWLAGESLSDRIKRAPIPVREAIEILDPMCDALQAAHEKNVVHCDLKSDNVFLVESRGKRFVKLLDFGLAKLSNNGVDDVETSSTKHGIVVGTPAYMAPEQARNQPVDGRTDIYALGCLAFKMLTGRIPFKGKTAIDIIAQQLDAPPPRAIDLAPETPRELSQLIVAMMAKSPDDRPSLVELRGVFASLLHSSRTSTRAVTGRAGPTRGKVRLPVDVVDLAAAPDGRSARLMPMLAVAALALVVVIAATLFVLRTRGHDAPPVIREPTLVVAVEAIDAGVTVEPIIEMEDESVAHRDAAVRRKATPGNDDTYDGDNTPLIAKRPGKLTVILQHESSISIDGKVVATASRGGSFDVTPGAHTVKITAPDRDTLDRSVSVEPGGAAVVRIVDDPAGN